MYYQKYKYSLLLITFISTSLVTSQSVGKDEPLKISQILIQPEITRCIQGHTILDRKKYFNLCDHGSSFDQRVSKEIYSELVHDYGVSFGRRLGGLAQWGSELDEDMLIKIMTQPKNAIVKQFEALLKMDGVKLEIKEDALKQIAQLAVAQNTEVEV